MKTTPQDFASALEAAGLAEFFADCTDAHRNEYFKWIGEAKRPETRQARITKAVQMVSGKCAEEKARPRKKGRTKKMPNHQQQSWIKLV